MRRPVAGPATVLATAGLLAGACGLDDEPPPAEVAAPADCDELAAEAGDLAVAVADHASTSAAGLPPAALDVQHPDDLDPWEVTAALAGDDPQLEERVEAAARADQRLDCPADTVHAAVETRVGRELEERGEALREDFDRDQHAALNLMAVVTATFAPPPESGDVPEGFPAEFPVHPDARLVEADQHEDGEVVATWEVTGEGVYEPVADFYLDALQEPRLGGWDVSGSEGTEEAGVNGGAEGHQRLRVTGYRYEGEVEIASDGPDRATITARLTPQR